MSDNLSLSQGATLALNSGALAEGTNANTIQIAAAINYVIDGRFYSKSITDNIAISYSGPTVYQAPTGVGSVNGSFTGGTGGSTRLYLIGLNAAGAVSIVPSEIVPTAELAAGTNSLEFPDAPSFVCPIGVLRIAVTAGTTFIPGSVDLSASGVTASFLNLSTVPATPLTA
jgi:hypothetical protein